MSSSPASPQRQSLDQLRHTISHLSFHSLRVELSRRNLNPCGLRASLEARLLADLTKAYAPGPTRPSSSSLRVGAIIHRRRKRSLHALSVPRRFPDASGLFSTILTDAELKKDTGLEAKAEEQAKYSVFLNVQAKRKKTSQCVGVLKGRSVWIVGEEQMVAFWEEHGPCGKANLSRSAPSYNAHRLYDATTIKGRALRQLLTLEENDGNVESDHNEELNVEHLQLTLVEAYYCAFINKCLLIEGTRGGVLSDAQETWALFSRIHYRFPMLMVAYCRYRSAGWIPRSGVKYGVDWVLYPASLKTHSHAPYCIILAFGTASKQARIDRSWTALQNRTRLSKSVAKNLVIANVHVENELTVSSIQDAFRNVQISEITVDRWLP